MGPRCFRLGHLVECPKHHWPYRPGNSCISCDREAKAAIREEQKARQEAANVATTAKPAGKTKKFIAKLKPKYGNDKKDEKDEKDEEDEEDEEDENDEKDENKAKKHKDKHKKANR